MFLVRMLGNALIMALEAAAVVAVAMLAYRHPILFAATTAALAFVLGLSLEAARLRNELPFYFEGRTGGLGVLLTLVASGEAALKAALAGVVALLTFSGTDQNRLFWEAVVFGLCLYAASAVLGSLAWRLRIRPARWGYFRLAGPFGLLFSLGLMALVALSLIKQPSLGDVVQKALLETAARPTLEQASELLFLVKAWFDSVITQVAAMVVGPRWAPVIAVVLSVNVLAGFVIAVYAVAIADVVVRAERRLP